MDKRATRYETEEKAEFEVYGKNKVFYGVLKNLSETGAFLEVRRADGSFPEMGALLHIKIRLDLIRKTHRIDGEVKWHSEKGVGIQFMKKTDVLERMFRKVTF